MYLFPLELPNSGIVCLWTSVDVRSTLELPLQPIPWLKRRTAFSLLFAGFPESPMNKTGSNLWPDLMRVSWLHKHSYWNPGREMRSLKRNFGFTLLVFKATQFSRHRQLCGFFFQTLITQKNWRAASKKEWNKRKNKGIKGRIKPSTAIQCVPTCK